MAQNPIRTAATANNGLVTGTLLEAIVKRNGYVLNVNETLGDLDFDVGEPPLVILSAAHGAVFFYDATDTTTPDDGTTTLVSGNGLRYKLASSSTLNLNAVLAVLDAPPSDPTVGDAYRVDAAATGDFAGQDDNIALYTRRGWVFATPLVGMAVFNIDTGTNQQYTDSGWIGFAAEPGAGSVTPGMLQFPAGLVVESTLNTAPGSPTEGKLWIVGAVPTDDFVGHAGDLAYWTGSEWAFYEPDDGWTAYNKQAGFPVHYGSGVWLGAAGSDFQEFSTAGSSSWIKPAKGALAFIQVWGAGGSGGRNSSGDAGSGGGGGAYLEAWIPLALLGSSETVTVGAGGAARTTADTNGQAGGNSSFGSHLTAFGGGRGLGLTGGGTSAGGGGGIRSAGGDAVSEGVGGNGGQGVVPSLSGGPLGFGPAPGSAGPGGDSIYGGGGGGVINVGSSSTQRGGHSVLGGGGGGTGHASGTGGAGGSSMYGGGGGGGGGGSAAGAGGSSMFGGAGGAGATGSNNAAAGQQPGGGGGGSVTGNSGKGGDGRVRVTVI